MKTATRTFAFKALLLLTAFCSACGTGGEERSDAATAASWAGSPETSFTGVLELTELHGKTMEEVMEVMGEPAFQQEITLHAGETLSEFMIEVHNTYPPDDPSTEGRIILHMQWEREGFSEAVFLHQPSADGAWVVLESLKWSNDVEF